MVVLDGHGTNQVLSGASGGPNQYLQPDYLSPLPTTLDSKKSPLALLVQTCSQIGADSPSTKFESHTTSKRKSSLNVETSRYESDRPRSGGSTSSNNSNNPQVTKISQKHSISSKLNHHDKDKNNSGKISPPRGIPPGVTESDSPPRGLPDSESVMRAQKRSPSSCTTTSPVPPSKVSRVSPPVSSNSNSSSSSNSNSNSNNSKNNSKNDDKKSDPQGQNPIVRSGLEVLNGGRLPSNNSGIPMPSSLTSLNYPYDMMNPAFRLPFMGGHNLPTYPPSPYTHYTRVKTPSGGESIVPVCKDPYCTGCQYSNPPANFPQTFPPQSSQGFCPAGCAQCDHQKIPYHFALSMGYPPGLLSQHSAQMSLLQQQAHHHQLLQQQQQQVQAQQQAQQNSQSARPYVCNWIVGDNYCGKRFGNSEDLLQHLRTHTQNLSQNSESAALQALQQQQLSASLYSNMLNPAIANAMRSRPYPTPPAISPYGIPPSKHIAMPPGWYPPVSAYSLYGLPGGNNPL